MRRHERQITGLIKRQMAFFAIIFGLFSLCSSCSGPKAWNVEVDHAGLWYRVENDCLLYLEKTELNEQIEYRMVTAAASPREYPSSQLWFTALPESGSYVCEDDPRLTLTISGIFLTLEGYNSDGKFSEKWTGVNPEYRKKMLDHYQADYRTAKAKTPTSLEEVYQRTRLFILVNFLENAKLSAR